MAQPTNLMSEVVLTEEQREHVRVFAKKFGGNQSLLRVLNEACVRMSLDIFQYENRLENERKEVTKHPERAKYYINRSQSGIEQSLGQLIAFSEMARVLLEDKYNGSDFETNAAIERWFNVAQHHFDNPKED